MCKTNLICHKIKFPAHLVVVSQASAAPSEQQTDPSPGTTQTTQRFVQIACDLRMHFDDDVANVNSYSILAIFLSSHADAELWPKILRANKSILKTVINVVSYFWQFNALHVWKSAKTNSPNRRKTRSTNVVKNKRKNSCTIC